MILGENGAGKSTVMRILLTTVTPDAGAVSVGGHDVLRDDLSARATIGFVVGSERSWEWRLSGRENLRFFASLYRVERASADRRIEAWLQRLGLADAADRLVGTYSSGMKLRLAVARALLHHPTVLLLDEPTHALDPVATADFHATLSEVVEGDEVAALYATHDLHEAAAVASEVLVLRGGRISASITPPVSAEQLATAMLAA